MPVLTINTNVNVPNNFSKDMVSIVAKALGKPESYVAVMVNPLVNLVWGGSNDPAAVCSLASIGQISAEQNKQASKVIQSAIETELGIPTSRQYLTFENLKKENVGYQATTFAELM